MRIGSRAIAILAPAAWLLATPTAAYAYIGPGLGIGAIGVAFGIAGSMLLGMVSVVWYPLKRLFRRLRGRPGIAPPDPA